MKWIKRWIFIKTKFWLLIRPAITFLYFLRSMVVIPVSAGFIKMISWSTIPRIRSCNDVFCSTKNIKFFHEYGHVPNKGLQNRMSCHCTTLSSVAVRGYQKNCQSIWAHNQQIKQRQWKRAVYKNWILLFFRLGVPERKSDNYLS